MDIQQLINSSFSLRLVYTFARLLPPRLGYRMARLAADQIAAQRDSDLVRAVRSNQWVVCGETRDKETLDRAVLATFRNWARAIFDLYHYLEDPDSTGQLIVTDERVRQLIRRPEFDRRGLLIIGLHISNFDLVLQWLCRQMISPLVLTIPNPRGGRRVEYEIRKKTGMNLVPVSIEALRHAVSHLKEGGVVLTGIDRPISEPRSRPRFFGRPAALPLHHIFLGMKARVPMLMAVNYLEPDGKQHVITSDLIEMDSYPNHEHAMAANGEKVLALAEEFIRRAPQQWSVPLPVWPETMDLVPG